MIFSFVCYAAYAFFAFQAYGVVTAEGLEGEPLRPPMAYTKLTVRDRSATERLKHLSTQLSPPCSKRTKLNGLIFFTLSQVVGLWWNSYHSFGSSGQRLENLNLCHRHTSRFNRRFKVEFPVNERVEPNLIQRNAC